VFLTARKMLWSLDCRVADNNTVNLAIPDHSSHLLDLQVVQVWSDLQDNFGPSLGQWRWGKFVTGLCYTAEKLLEDIFILKTSTWMVNLKELQKGGIQHTLDQEYSGSIH
jgi:hypothetical protein